MENKNQTNGVENLKWFLQYILPALVVVILIVVVLLVRSCTPRDNDDGSIDDTTAGVVDDTTGNGTTEGGTTGHDTTEGDTTGTGTSANSTTAGNSTGNGTTAGTQGGSEPDTTTSTTQGSTSGSSTSSTSSTTDVTTSITGAPSDSTPSDGTVEIDGTYTEGLVLPAWRRRSDANNVGVTSGWYTKYSYVGNSGTPSTFPGRYENVQYLWFATQFVPDFTLEAGERVMLRFGGMPYYTQYWVNGTLVGNHTGRTDTFVFDVTDLIKLGQTNFIVIRSQNPGTANAIDGLYYKHIGLSYSEAPRVQQPAYLYVQPGVYAEETVVSADCNTGYVNVTYTLKNATTSSREVVLSGLVQRDDSDIVQARVRKTVTAPVGTSTHTISIPVKNFRYWSPEDPFLYEAILTVDNQNGTAHTVSQRTAFRTLKINASGFFELNGKEYFLKGVFGGASFAASFDQGEDPYTYYDWLSYMKSCGINTIRFLDCVPIPEVLDMCDKLGLIVYSEHPMAWHKVDDTQGRTPQLFKNEVIAALKTLRSHPSVLMFGFQNETEVITSGASKTSDQYNTILTGPSWARSYAKDMIFFFSSGRFDGNQSVASASNPGSYTWDAYLGNESSSASSATREHISNTYTSNMGDLHYYPLQPYAGAVRIAYNTLATYSKGVLLSEAGSGSMYDIFTTAANRSLEGRWNKGAYDAQIAAFRTFYETYGLDRAFASPEAIVEASNELSAVHRSRILTLVRRTSTINGYYMTSIADANGLGEGLLGEYNERKDGIYEAINEGYDDIRFCVTTDSLSYYQGSTINLRVDFSDLSGTVSKTTAYTVRIRVRGPGGTEFVKDYSFKHTGAHFVTSVVGEAIPITTAWEPGEYTVSATFLSGVYAECGTEYFQVFSKSDLPSLTGKKVYLFGLTNDSTVRALLQSKGATVASYSSSASIASGNVVLVGNTSPSTSDMNKLVTAANSGAHIVFLTKTGFVSGNAIRSELGIAGSMYTYNNWLYHTESITLKNKVTAGIRNNCLVDSLYFEHIYSPSFIYNCTVPTDTSVATVWFGGNDHGLSEEFRGGFQLATYKKGSGYLTLSTLTLDGGNSNGQPLTESLICNLVAYS